MCGGEKSVEGRGVSGGVEFFRVRSVVSENDKLVSFEMFLQEFHLVILF